MAQGIERPPVTEMALQFSAERQHSLFSGLYGQDGFFFYLALSCALVGMVILLVRPSLWRWQYICCYILLLLFVFIFPGQKSDIFFKDIAFEKGAQAQRIFSPQAVILDVGDKLQREMEGSFPVAPEEYVNQILALEGTTFNDLQYQLESGYYRDICEPVGGNDTYKFIGKRVHVLAKTPEGIAFADKLAHSYFNIKHVSRLVTHYYDRVEHNPLISAAVNPVYGILLTNDQSTNEIKASIAKRLESYISRDDLEALGWQERDTWSQEAEGIKADIKVAEDAAEEEVFIKGQRLPNGNLLKIKIPLPGFLLRPYGHDGYPAFRESMEMYVTPYGFRKQLEHPVVIAFGGEDTVLNCLDFHERMVEKLEGMLQKKIAGWPAMVEGMKRMLPPHMQDANGDVVVDEIILPHIAQKLYLPSSFPRGDFENKVSHIFPYVQSLLLSVFLFVTPLLLIAGLAFPFWGIGLLFLTILGVGWLELWQLFITIGEGVYQHIAPFMLTDISLDGMVAIYIYGLAVVHGIVSLLAILLLPVMVKSLPFAKIKPTEGKGLFDNNRDRVLMPQLEGLIEKLKDSLPERIKQQMSSEEHRQRTAMRQNKATAASERITEKVSEKMRHTERAESYVTTTKEQAMARHHMSANNGQRTPEERGVSQQSVSGNAYGMFQKVMQENYMTLGHDAVDALHMTEKYMRGLDEKDLRSGEDNGKKYVEVKQSSMKEQVSGGQKTADGYVRFYNRD